MRPFATCTEAIEQWRHEYGSDSVMRVGKSRISAAQDLAKTPTVYRLAIELRGGFHSWAIPMEMEVTPRYSFATMIDLLPRHHVLLLRRYFRAGHLFLDTVIQVIESQSGPPSR
jgi:hypothetical protein